MQHNFVRVYLQPAEAFVSGVRPPQFLYEPCTDWVLQLLRCVCVWGGRWFSSSCG